MADGNIHVYFHSAESDSSQDEENISGNENDNKSVSKPKSNKSTARSAIATTAIDYANKSMNYGISVFGDLTGDYQTQRGMQSFVNGVSTLSMMANFPFGTIAGAFKMGTDIISSIINTRNANRQSEMIRKRTGNEVLNDSEGK